MSETVDVKTLIIDEKEVSARRGQTGGDSCLGDLPQQRLFLVANKRPEITPLSFCIRTVEPIFRMGSLTFHFRGDSDKEQSRREAEQSDGLGSRRHWMVEA
jgi:hypothetical protein